MNKAKKAGKEIADNFKQCQKTIESMAKLIRAAKCYNCIHKFEAKKK